MNQFMKPIGLATESLAAEAVAGYINDGRKVVAAC